MALHQPTPSETETWVTQSVKGFSEGLRGGGGLGLNQLVECQRAARAVLRVSGLQYCDHVLRRGTCCYIPLTHTTNSHLQCVLQLVSLSTTT